VNFCQKPRNKLEKQKKAKTLQHFEIKTKQQQKIKIAH
jgi:hypothetical protein